MAVQLYDLVDGPQGPPAPGHNILWQDEAREEAELERIALGASGSEGNNTAIAGTPYVPEHWFDPRDGAVTATPIFTTNP